MVRGSGKAAGGETADAEQSSQAGGTGAGRSVCQLRPLPGQATLPLDGLPGAGAAWGTWLLAAAGREWEISLIPLPATGPCDHAFGTASYRPSPVLRALTEIRDGGCALPVCGRPARHCEWEHGIPWPQGLTCSCNGSMHCTKDHRLKEAKGWHIQQRPDGTRTWTTPKGLTYPGHHKQYPD